jgi:acyl-CoA synthetase (AMP-forming)/AMP-acid ligase II/thioesterase domain-containing protein/NAD(P)-dependent dehydrogenase (short-subunit alcohol dehydrogenase family)/acyl carrier protein
MHPMAVMLENTQATMESLEQALLGLAPVEDAAVLLREVDGKVVALLFVVTPTNTVDERLFDDIGLPQAWGHVVVPMQSLPYTSSGEVDRAALDALGIADLTSSTLAERDVKRLPGVQVGTALVRPNVVLPRRYHIEHLLPRDSANDRDAHSDAPDSGVRQVAASTTIALVETPSLVLPPNTPTTLGTTLVRAASMCPDPRITYVTDGGKEIRQTFGELLAEAESILSALRQRGLVPGNYVLFQIVEPRNILPTFWACLLGGFIPVICPVAPSFDTVTTDLEKLLHVWKLLDKPLVVSEASHGVSLAQLQRHLDGSPGPIPVVERMRQQPRDGKHHEPKPDDTAFLVLTSGSTGAPKCIAMSHANILSRGRGANEQCNQGESDVILNWLPFDHIGSISDWHLRCVDLRCRMVYSTKEHVLGNPLHWLDLIDRYRITHSWAPNFAYALINAALDSQPNKNWDLSCMKSLLTAGEAVSSTTVEEFLTRLASFGLARSAVRPAFGMAELGSGITYFKPTLTQPYAALSVDRRSLTGTLVPVAADSPRRITFTGLGTVIAGMAMRIVDEDGQVVTENKIGNLHVKGEAVTSGYVRNPEANAKVMLGGGWFDTGDRGFILGGQLFLTGRSKETIIVNGSNYYPGELEAAAEQVPGVLVSHTAACAVRPVGAGTERVALFLCHEPLPADKQSDLLRDVVTSIVKKTGVKPDYVLPLSPHEIPKTAIGKIQRAELGRRFERGEYDQLVQEVDCLLENDNTLPNRFYRVVWRPATLRRGQRTRDILTVVFSDAHGLSDKVCSQLSQTGAPVLKIAAGASFSFGAELWSVDWSQAAQLDQVCGMLAQMGVSQFELLDLRSYAPVVAATSTHALEESLKQGCLQVVTLLQVLKRHNLLPRHYWSVACGAEPAAGGDSFDPGRNLTIPLLRSFEHGTEQFRFHHLDVPFGEPVEALAGLVCAELVAPNKERQIAYRSGTRLVSKLELIDWTTSARVAHPLLSKSQLTQGFCLVTGGLGGLGVELTRALLRRGARVLLIGRRAVSPEVTTTLSDLERLGPVRYAAVDIAQSEQVNVVVNEAAQAWGVPLLGVFHLAGVAREAAVEAETNETILATLGPKVFGTFAIEQVLTQYPDAFCVLFSSAVTTIDTSQTAAYAMANAYLDAWAAAAKQRGRLVHCFNWSPWEAVGMNAHATISPALRAKGLESTTLRSGLNSMLVGVGIADARIIVGLNPDNPRIGAFLHRSQPAPKVHLEGFYIAQRADKPLDIPRVIQTTDSFGRTLAVPMQELARMPLDARGDVDTTALASQLARKGSEKTPPRTNTERQLADIFSKVLGVDSVGVNESFFDLGGTSLLSLSLFGEIEQQFGIRLPAAALLETPSVEQIAKRLDPTAETRPVQSLVQITTSSKGAALFLVHDADGETILYRTLALALTGTPVFALQPPGEGSDEVVHTSIEQMSKYYIDQMRQVQPNGPYILGGLCAGGIIAFDMACRLQAEGEQVAMVVLLDAADSQAPKANTGVRADRFRSAVKGARSYREVFRIGSDKLRNFVKYEAQRRVQEARNKTTLLLLRELNKRGITAPAPLRKVKPRVVFDFAQRDHTPGTFSGKLLLVRATEADPSQSAAGFDDTPAILTTTDPLLGWSTRSTEGIDVLDVPGGHSSMLQQPNVAVVAKELRTRIKERLSELS